MTFVDWGDLSTKLNAAFAAGTAPDVFGHGPAAVADFAGAYSGPWNPFEAGRLAIDYTVSNTGNTRLSVTPQITATAVFRLVTLTASGEEIVEFAPGDSRSGRITIPAAWPWLAYTVGISVTPEGVGTESSLAVETASATASVAAIPWPQLGVVAVGAVLIRWLWVENRRRRPLDG